MLYCFWTRQHHLDYSRDDPWLHLMGYAHSFEVWHENTLVGGLYGLSFGHAFFGESMFHTVTDASKIAFYYLCKTMVEWDFDFIDCQIPFPHLHSFGAKIISRKEFLHLLNQSLEYPTKQGLWKYFLDMPFSA